MIEGHVLVAGAGIGGLTLACALARAGREVTVLERCPEMQPCGVGISLHANAFAAFRDIGLDARVVQIGQIITAARLCSSSGRVITEAPEKLVEREFGAASVAVAQDR